MRDTFCASCGPSTRNGYIRGTDEALRETHGAGATPTTRGKAAGGGTSASGGRTAGGRLTPDSDALGEAAPAGRTGGAASRRALRTPGTAVRITARGAGAVAEGRVAGRRLHDGAVDAAADCAIDRGQILSLDGALFSMATARAARLERAAAERPGARARCTGDSHLEGQ